MTKNDSPSAILLCTSIITILLTVKLHNILFQQIFITSFITKISMPQLSVTKELYIVTTTMSKSIELTVQIYLKVQQKLNNSDQFRKEGIALHV